MFFKDEDHRKDYQILMAKAKGSNSNEYSAALYLLAAIDFKKVAPYIASNEINFPSLIKACRSWSTGEKGLVKLASVLFNDTSYKANVGDVFRSLDGQNTRIALDALKIRYE